MLLRRVGFACTCLALFASYPLAAQEQQAVHYSDAGVAAPQRLSCPFPGAMLGSALAGAPVLVNATFVVSAGGLVDPNSVMIETENQMLQTAVYDMLCGCQFKPGTKDGQAAQVGVSMPMTFHTNGYVWSAQVAPPPADELLVAPRMGYDEVATWLTTRLPDFGSFAVRVTPDASISANNLTTDNLALMRSDELRHRLIDVKLEDCTLYYASIYQATTGQPIRTDWVIPFTAIEPSQILVQPIELPLELRAQQARSEVFIITRRGGVFIGTPEDGAPRQAFQLGIPVDNKDHAQEVAEMLVEAIRACGGN